MVWPLFAAQSDDKFFGALEPQTLSIQLATMWLRGTPYSALFAHSKTSGGSKPWGEKQRRKLTDDDIIDFCENTLGFECALVLAAVAQFLFGEASDNEESSAALTVFQKSLKYGLPDTVAISCYDYGFADRVVAQRLCDQVRADGFAGQYFAPALVPHRIRVDEVLAELPSYFSTVLAGRSSS